jgi:hypothetical protein
MGHVSCEKRRCVLFSGSCLQPIAFLRSLAAIISKTVERVKHDGTVGFKAAASAGPMTRLRSAPALRLPPPAECGKKLRLRLIFSARLL